MSIAFNTLQNALFTWATANTPANTPVLWLYPNAPRPTTQYVTLLISSFVQIGRDWNNSPTTTSGIGNFVGDREFTLQVQAYGDTPMQVLENLRTSLQKTSVLSALNAAGIVYVNWNPILDITDLVDSRYEQRCTMDLLFRLAQKYTDNLGFIANVELQEIYVNQTGAVVSDVTTTITSP
jgi:hypothetical protein